MSSDPTTVQVTTASGGYAQTITTRGHTLVADEPIDLGGTDTGPTPFELLLSALGSCTSITCQMYAARKEWPLDGVTVRLSHAKQTSDDGQPIDVITKTVEFAGDLTDEQRARLRVIADKCPVHKTLTGDVRIVDGDG